MADTQDLIGYSGLIAAGTALKWAFDTLFQWRKQQGDTVGKQAAVRLDTEKHRDDLMFRLLEAAKAQVETTQVEMQDLREELRTLEIKVERVDALEQDLRMANMKSERLQRRLTIYEEAVGHLYAVLEAKRDGSSGEAPRNAARAFLARVEIFAKIEGDAAQQAHLATLQPRIEGE